MEGSGGSDGYLGDAIGLDGDRQPAVAHGLRRALAGVRPQHGVSTRSRIAAASSPSALIRRRGRTMAAPRLRRPPRPGWRPSASSTASRLAAAISRGVPRAARKRWCWPSAIPTCFDGIVADAPGISIPRAGLAQVWDTRAFAAIIQARGETPSPANLATSFDAADFALVKQAILAACDRDDGVLDGMVGAYRQCTSAKVLPQLARVTCAGAKQAGCLSTAQVEALRRVHQGVRNAKGAELYAPFPWDGGWADMEWRLFKIGADEIPALGLLLGGAQGAGAEPISCRRRPSLRGPQPAMDFIMRFDLDRDGPRIYAKDGVFTRSAWQDYGARSPDLAAFRRRGGKMIVVHGLSDPIFSAADTMAWYEEVANARAGASGISCGCSRFRAGSMARAARRRPTMTVLPRSCGGSSRARRRTASRPRPARHHPGRDERDRFVPIPARPTTRDPGTSRRRTASSANEGGAACGKSGARPRWPNLT